MAKIPPVPTVASIKVGQYFQQRKKGEMSQLKSLLSGVINTNDTKKGRQVVKKIIGYMTLGMDASPVFSQMCRASFMNDQVMKKMIYFYLTTYAEDNPDLSIMAINTFKKDCKHTSAKIRGLALRNLCSFRSSDYVNSVLPTLRQLILDFDPYVKKTAIAGILKVFYHEPATILTDTSILDSLSFAIKQSDPLVSTNALLALDEILVSEGGVPLNKKLFFYLLHRLQEYDSWQQSGIINILYRYNPDNEKQQYEIMTVLWQNLKRSSAALVLGSIRIIIKLAKQKQDLFKNVVEKIKAPLLTIMSASQSNGSCQTTFIVLEHIEYVIKYMNGKSQYEKDFKYFYCKIDEPTYIKNIKVKILGMLANEFNLGDMLNQLNEYANDVDVQIAVRSVHVLADIALRLPDVSKALMINLISFYKTQQQHLVNSSIVCFYRILRKYPKLFSQVKQSLLNCHHLINENESIKAFIWVIGTFAQQIDEAPYILEDYIENEDQFGKLNDEVKQVLLTQIVQTFVKRPPETIKTLGRVFKLIFHDDHSSILLQDHAGFYYRALKDNPEEVKKGFISILGDMSKEKESLGEVSAQEDFNTLGIIYKKKQAKFIKNYEYFQSMRNKQLGLVQVEQMDEDQEQETEQVKEQAEEVQFEQNDSELFESLVVQSNLTAEQFEQTWNQLESYNEANFRLQNENYLDEQSVEELFKMWRLFVMASADEQDGTILKFYMYTKHTRGGFVCVEVQIDKKQKILALTTKASHQNLAISINNYIKDFMQVNQFIVS